jgi:hypothetical protein
VIGGGRNLDLDIVRLTPRPLSPDLQAYVRPLNRPKRHRRAGRPANSTLGKITEWRRVSWAGAVAQAGQRMP